MIIVTVLGMSSGLLPMEVLLRAYGYEVATEPSGAVAPRLIAEE
jgi:hypothetical protein